MKETGLTILRVTSLKMKYIESCDLPMLFSGLNMCVCVCVCV